MQINPINPIAEIPAVNPAGGTRNPADKASAGVNLQPASPGNSTSSDLERTSPTDRAARIEDAMRSLDKAVRAADIALNFSRDEETGSIVVKLVDQTSGETLQQIPTDALLHLSAELGKLQGKLINRRA